MNPQTLVKPQVDQNGCLQMDLGPLAVTVCDKRNGGWTALSSTAGAANQRYPQTVRQLTVDQLYEEQVREREQSRILGPGWLGIYSTNHGKLVLKPAGPRRGDGTQAVKGFMGDDESGVLLGTMDGEVLQGDYRDGDDAGSFVITLKAPKLTSFSGQVQSSRDRSAGRIPWTGSKIRSLGQDEVRAYD